MSRFINLLCPLAVCFFLFLTRLSLLGFPAERQLLVTWGTSLVLLPSQKRDHKRIFTPSTLIPFFSSLYKGRLLFGILYLKESARVHWVNCRFAITYLFCMLQVFITVIFSNMKHYSNFLFIFLNG